MSDSLDEHQTSGPVHCLFSGNVLSPTLRVSGFPQRRSTTHSFSTSCRQIMIYVGYWCLLPGLVWSGLVWFATALCNPCRRLFRSKNSRLIQMAPKSVRKSCLRRMLACLLASGWMRMVDGGWCSQTTDGDNRRQQPSSHRRRSEREVEKKTVHCT